jgi:hypothetical protein
MDNPRGFGDREVAVMEKIASTFSTNPLQELIKRVIANVTRTSPARSIH